MKTFTVVLMLTVLSPLDAQDREIESIQQQLTEMAAADQAIRRQFNPATPDAFVADEMERLDRMHTTALKQILNTYNWITISVFGEEAEHNAWLLVQHASHDLDFQKTVLAKLEKLIDTKETCRKRYAYLYDRVAMHEGRPQRYGTQLKVVHGALVPYEIENREQLNTLRATVGLQPFEEYLATVNAMYK